MPYSQDPHPKVGITDRRIITAAETSLKEQGESEPNLELKTLGLGAPTSGT